MGELCGECSCGRTHTQGIDEIAVKNGVSRRLGDYVRKNQWAKVAVICDPTTYRVAGQAIAQRLDGRGEQVHTIILGANEGRALIPDESSLGMLLMQLPAGTDGLIAVGSGTINDLTRYVGFRLNIPFVSIPTAPSMDGYASSVSPLHLGSFKKTFSARPPKAIFADTAIVATAPEDMVAAGFGDLIGKITAKADWQMSHVVTGEYFCERPLEVVASALEKCTDNSAAIREGSPELLEFLMEGLILSGVAIMMTGNSRPASGPEHLLAHFWEVHSAMTGEYDAFHGTKVGVATPISISFFKKLFSQDVSSFQLPRAIDATKRMARIEAVYGNIAEDVVKESKAKWLTPEELQSIQSAAMRNWKTLQRIAAELPAPEAVINQLHLAGGATTVKDIRVRPELLRDALLYSKEMRSRFTVFDLAECLGCLEPLVDEVVAESGR